MKNFAKKQHGLTLTEIMVATIALSVITAVAMPNYNKAVEKSYYRQALTNLNTIKSAAENYRAIHRTFGVNGAEFKTLPEINSHLGINISDDHFSYIYAIDGGALSIQLKRNKENNNGYNYQLKRRLEYNDTIGSSEDSFKCVGDCKKW
ncbi:MAG: prepilin-type N-terminal cleavage/methylation domain-containing protein [Candidatus Omnitrophica bacterium]|nr:prepilin-type N-terminal cleavage/methylation domain-containing protein [Candidatus Omnitrophota bacterium]